MKKIQFGSLRSIEVFDKNTDEGLILQWRNFVEKIVLKGKMSEFIIEIFGTVNEMHPITVEDSTGNVFVFDPIADSNILIAKSKGEFNTIVSDILEIWKDNRDEAILRRDKKNIDQFRSFTKKFQEVTDVNINWWVNFAFKELNFRFI